MINTRKSIIVTLLILCLATAAVFANAEIEKVKVSKETESYSSLDLETASFETIMKAYQAEIDNYNTKYESIYNKMVQSYNEGNVDDYFDAKGMLRNLSVPMITYEQTQILVDRIANAKDDASASEFASWLYENSQFYRPQIILTKAQSEEENSKYRFRYSYTITKEPGSTVTLPTMNTTFTEGGVFAGWGTTADEVTYEAGSEITMPYSDLTLYAVYKSGVMFYDSVTGTEVFEEGDNINAPALEAPDETYVFAGWYDSNGQKADGSTTLEDGESAAYYAGWKSVFVSDVWLKNKSSMNVTSGKEYKLGFSAFNKGNINTGSLTFELVPNDDSIEVLSGVLSTNGIKVWNEKNGYFDIRVSGNSGDIVKADIVVTDADGNTWKTPVEITVK